MQAVEAITLEDNPRLRILLQRLRDAPVTVAILAETGISILFDDLRPWSKAKVGAQAELLRDKWRKLLVEAHRKGVQVEVRNDKTFRGLSAHTFLETVDRLEQALMVGREEDRLERYRYLAMQLALRGFDSQQSLDGLDVQDIPELCITAWDRATLVTAAGRRPLFSPKRRQNHGFGLLRSQLFLKDQFLRQRASPASISHAH